MQNDDILEYLFKTSFADESAPLEELFERLGEIEDLETRKGPLDAALKKLGLKGATLDVEGVRLDFETSEDYSAARDELFSADAINALAELGWVPQYNGDTAPEVIDPPRYSIHFLALDEGPKPDAKQMTDKAAKKDIDRVAGHFVGDEGPVDTKPEKLKKPTKESLTVEQEVAALLGEKKKLGEGLTTFANETVIFQEPTGEAFVEVDDARAQRKGKRMFVAVSADGFLTDYPRSINGVVNWDNPEYFSEEFRAKVDDYFRGQPSLGESKAADLKDLKAKHHKGSSVSEIDAAWDMGNNRGRQDRINSRKSNPQPSGLKGDQRTAYERGYAHGFKGTNEAHSVPDRHQLRIARDTLRMSDAGARIMGGMTKEEARAVIMRLTGKRVREEPEGDSNPVPSGGDPAPSPRAAMLRAKQQGESRSVRDMVDRMLDNDAPISEMASNPARARFTSFRPENQRMMDFLKDNGIDGVHVKYLRDGSMRGSWRIWKPGEKWSQELADQFNALGFTEGSSRGEPLNRFSGNGGEFSIFIRGHDELAREPSAPVREGILGDAEKYWPEDEAAGTFESFVNDMEDEPENAQKYLAKNVAHMHKVFDEHDDAADLKARYDASLEQRMATWREEHKVAPYQQSLSLESIDADIALALVPALRGEQGPEAAEDAVSALATLCADDQRVTALLPRLRGEVGPEDAESAVEEFTALFS